MRAQPLRDALQKRPHLRGGPALLVKRARQAQLRLRQELGLAYSRDSDLHLRPGANKISASIWTQENMRDNGCAAGNVRHCFGSNAILFAYNPSSMCQQG